MTNVKTRKPFNTTFEIEFIKEMKMQALKEDMQVNELIKKMFFYYQAQQNKQQRA